MDPIAEPIITRELLSDEKILWAGRPKRDLVLRASDAFMIPFSILWCATILFSQAEAIAEGASPSFLALGLPFILFGVYLLFGRFVLDARRRRRTYHGLTNQRAIIISGILRRQIKSLNLRTISDVSLTERRNRIGTITLGPSNWMATWFGGWMWHDQGFQPSFELIDNAREVYEKLCLAQKEA